MEIKVLGTGCCSTCATLTKNAEEAVKAMGINASVEEVTDIEKIISYGIMRTPALVVDEKVLSVGKVLTVEEISSILGFRNHSLRRSK